MTFEDERDERDERERVVPHDLDAERAVLGSLLVSRGAMLAEVLSEGLDETDFFRPAHQAIWRACVRAYDQHQACDVLLVEAVLEERGEAWAADLATLTGLLTAMPTAVHAAAYARRVRDTATLRRLIAAGGEMAGAAYSHAEDVGAAIDAAEGAVLRALARHAARAFRSLEELTGGYVDRLEAIGKGTVREGVPTGLPDLDRVTGGLHPGQLVILAARPGMGKSALAVQVAHHVAAQTGRSAAIFSLEMSAEELIHRLVSAQTGIDGFRLRTGRLGDPDWSALWSVVGPLGQVPVYVDDTPALTVLTLRAKARQLALLRQHDAPLGLVVVDYLQLMAGTPGRAREGRTQEVSEVSRGLKALAKELGVPILACAQLNRAVDDRPAHRPHLSDLRESGQLEADADLVLFLVRDELYDPRSPKAGTADLLLAKHRAGALADMALRFDAQTTRFEALDTRHEEDRR